MEAKIRSSREEALARSENHLGRFILTSAIILTALAVTAVFGISAYVGWNLTHPGREKIEYYPDAAGLVYEDVSFKSREGGLNLKGWLIQARDSEKTIIFAHGYRKNRLNNDVPILPIATAMVNKGYNVLMFDFRNCGESEGNLTSVGQYEVLDLLGAIDFIKSKPELSQKLVLYGFSMGAAVTIMAGAREQAVTAVIADSPFADLKSYLMKNLGVWTNLPSFPFNQSFLVVVPPLTGLRTETVSPIKEIKNFNGRPVLLIHGEADTDIPIENSELLQIEYHKAQLLRVPGAKHIKAFATDSNYYLEAVSNFLDTL
ncbi:MAG: Alpha/beta hydrolase family protein [Pelotomaculum sp. PtaU1.Bin035]|nr:MAG: Alpha/beta hydrolase family protein [Pelotomaculum sp. PtaU1.Bin035]